MYTLKKISVAVLILILSIVSNAQRAVKTNTDYYIIPSKYVTSPLVSNSVEVPTSVLTSKLSLSNTEIKVATNNDPRAIKRVQEKSTSEKVLEWMKDKYSCMLNVMPNQINNKLLYSFIEEWYGVRYRMGGMNKSGIDCSAFVQKLYSNVFGSNIVRTACLQFNATTFIKSISDLKEGDLVFFRIGTSRISHVGVYLQNNCFVHSSSSKGVMISNLTDNYWTRYFAGGGRFKD